MFDELPNYRSYLSPSIDTFLIKSNLATIGLFSLECDMTTSNVKLENLFLNRETLHIAIDNSSFIFNLFMNDSNHKATAEQFLESRIECDGFFTSHISTPVAQGLFHLYMTNQSIRVVMTDKMKFLAKMYLINDFFEHNLTDVDAFISSIICLKYNQFHQYTNTIRIQATAAGHSYGGSTWLLEKGTHSIIVINKCNHRTEIGIDPLTFVTKTPDIVICDSLYSKIEESSKNKIISGIIADLHALVSSSYIFFSVGLSRIFECIEMLEEFKPYVYSMRGEFFKKDLIENCRDLTTSFSVVSEFEMNIGSVYIIIEDLPGYSDYIIPKILGNSNVIVYSFESNSPSSNLSRDMDGYISLNSIDVINPEEIKTTDCKDLDAAYHATEPSESGASEDTSRAGYYVEKNNQGIFDFWAEDGDIQFPSENYLDYDDYGEEIVYQDVLRGIKSMDIDLLHKQAIPTHRYIAKIIEVKIECKFRSINIPNVSDYITVRNTLEALGAAKEIFYGAVDDNIFMCNLCPESIVIEEGPDFVLGLNSRNLRLEKDLIGKLVFSKHPEGVISKFKGTIDGVNGVDTLVFRESSSSCFIGSLDISRIRQKLETYNLDVKLLSDRSISINGMIKLTVSGEHLDIEGFSSDVVGIMDCIYDCITVVI